jgi:polynucleotide 5'-kinase involved in rRNA processing
VSSPILGKYRAKKKKKKNNHGGNNLEKKKNKLKINRQRKQWKEFANLNGVDLRVFSSSPLNGLISSLIDNTNQCTNIKLYTFIYNPVRLQRVSIFFRSSPGSSRQTGVYKKTSD